MSKAAAPINPASDPVDALIKSIRIPPRPSLLADLQLELAKPEPAPKRIGKIVTSDVGMSGALLKLANSAIYGGVRKATSIDQAITFLGMNQVAALMTGLLARKAIPTDNAALSSFWELSTKRAQAMVFLAGRLRVSEADIAHTFGLFCDTGIPLLMDRFPGYASTLAAAARDAEHPFTHSEDARHSTNHAAIGCLLARNWGLSSDVSWAILHHHDYAVLEDTATDDTVRSLVALSLLAEAAIQKYQGHTESVEWDKGGELACRHLGLAYEEMADLLDELHDCFHGEA